MGMKLFFLISELVVHKLDDCTFVVSSKFVQYTLLKNEYIL